MDNIQANSNNIMLLGEEIYSLYLNNGFSKVMKAQIDEKVFHTFLISELSKINQEKFIIKKEVNYDEIDKNAIYELSLASGLTEAVVQSKIEKDFYVHHKDENSFDLKNFLISQLRNSKLNKNDFVKDGKIRFLIQNSVLKKKVINALNKEDTIVDFSFNKDLIVVNVFDVIDILQIDDERSKEILQKSVQEYLPKIENKKISEEMSEMKYSTVKETSVSIVKYLGKTAYEKFLDTAFSAMFARIN